MAGKNSKQWRSLTKDTRALEQRSIQPARECIVVPVIYSANPFFSGLNSDLFISSPAAVVCGRPKKDPVAKGLKKNLRALSDLMVLLY